jgi:prevent-host-death family protein
MAQYGMHEAKTNLSQLVQQAEAGEDVVIARNGKPVAKLVPVPKNRMASVWGALRGQIHINDDFDELPEDMARELGMID